MIHTILEAFLVKEVYSLGVSYVGVAKLHEKNSVGYSNIYLDNPNYSRHFKIATP